MESSAAGDVEGAPSEELGLPSLSTVGAVAAAVAIPASTLRSWDQRYGVGPTHRTPGNHRRYTGSDVHRIVLMAQLTGQGLAAGAAATVVRGLNGAELQRRAERAIHDSRSHVANIGSARASKDAIVAAASALDITMLSRLISDVLRGQSLDASWASVFVPALGEIGERWARGEIGIESEHLVSEVLGSELRQIARASAAGQSGAPVILASADQDLHHLPLLALEAALSQLGVRTALLGASLPWESMAAALEQTGAREVFLWASLPRPDHDVVPRVAKTAWGPLTLITGGPGWTTQPEVGPGSGEVRLKSARDLAEAVQFVMEARSAAIA